METFKPSSNKKLFKILGIIALLLIVCGIIGSQMEKESSSIVKSKPEADTTMPVKEIAASSNAPITAATKEPRIWQSLDDVKRRFNSFMGKYKMDFRIRDLYAKEGPKANTCLYQFDDNIGWVIGINKSDNSVEGIIMTGQGDGTKLSGLNIEAILMGLIGTTDTTLDGDERGKILSKLMSMTEIKEDDKTVKIVKNGILYMGTYSPGVIPPTFSVSVAD